MCSSRRQSIISEAVQKRRESRLEEGAEVDGEGGAGGEGVGSVDPEVVPGWQHDSATDRYTVVGR